jgi:hypothetical protein
VPPVHDPVGDAGLGQGIPPAHGLVRLVGQHRRFVTANERIGSDALPDVGAGEDRLADQVAAPAAASWLQPLQGWIDRLADDR